MANYLKYSNYVDRERILDEIERAESYHTSRVSIPKLVGRRLTRGLLRQVRGGVAEYAEYRGIRDEIEQTAREEIQRFVQ